MAELAESRLHELLPLECGLVLAVLPEIAQLDGFANLLREDDVQLVLELLGFFPEFFLELVDHVKPVPVAGTSLPKNERPTAMEGRAPAALQGRGFIGERSRRR